MFMVKDPARFEIVVTSNLFGDILTDLGAAIAGGMGLAAGANLNPERAYPSMFEPIHGSAPDIAGKGIANPLATAWSASQMLDFFGHEDLGARVIECIEEMLVEKKVLTPGHTAGVLSFVITLPDGTVAAMHGGIGTNTLRSSFLLSYGLSFDCRDDLKASCRKLMSERVALVLGNHPQQTETVEKMIRLENGENILDGEEWERFLNTVIEMVDGVEKFDPRPS